MTDTLQKKTYMRPTNIWKNVHHHWSSEKCKSKLHWDTILCQLEWWSLKIWRQQMLEGMWRNRNILHCWWECKLVQPLWKTVWRFLKDLEIEIPFDPAIPLLGICPKDYKSFYYKDTCTRMFIAALFTIAKTWNQPNCPLLIYWENVAHIHYGILCSNQKRWIHVLCRDMDEHGEHHSQQTDTRTENEIPHVLTHRRVLNNEKTWTQGGEHYTLGSIGVNRGGTVGWGELGRYSMGRNARCGWRGGRQQITLLHVYLCNCLACSAHAPQNLKCNKKLRKKKKLGRA